MKLPNGVTGFYTSKTNDPPQVDGKKFKQLCFDFAFHNGGKVRGFNTPQYPANFYYAQVEVLYHQFYILLNEHYPYLAFASAVGFGNIKFVDEPLAFEYFSLFYQVIGITELSIPFHQIPAEKNELNWAELREITYWNPETIGEIFFNYWD